jgi:SNF2 family DNA or RNA helicase
LDKQEYPLQHRTITQLSKAASILLDSGQRMTVMHLIALVTRKRQANVWPGGIEMKDDDGNVVFSVGDEVQESVKMDAVTENIAKFHKEGHRQVVFSQFKTALAEMERRLKGLGYRVVRLDGDTPEALRAEIKTNFYRAKEETPKWDILLANYKTGGVGLNLTSITKTHILDEEWNPGKRDQAYARSARMGQLEETDVYVYRIPGTIDTWMSNTIYRKEKLISEFTDVVLEKEEDIMTNLMDAIESGEIL